MGVALPVVASAAGEPCAPRRGAHTAEPKFLTGGGYAEIASPWSRSLRGASRMRVASRPSETSSRAHRDRDQRAVPNSHVRAAPEARLAAAIGVALLRLFDRSPAR